LTDLQDKRKTRARKQRKVGEAEFFMVMIDNVKIEEAGF
jgi:hypothetical protein